MPISSQDAKAELLALMHAWPIAVVAKDHAFFERHVDAGWRYIDYTGAQRGIQDYVVLIQDIPSFVQDYREFDVRVVSGSVALITGIYHARVDIRGRGFLEKLLAFSAVWEKRDGVWKALQHHTTELPS